MTQARIFMQHDAILDVIHGMARLIQQRLAERGIQDPVMVGIHTGGAWVAEHLHKTLAIKEPLGLLDISFYRDDFTQIGMHPQVKPSNIPFDIEGRHIILVDDVIQSGRTIRAAMNELFDFGRPAGIYLVSLIERNEREIPIQPDVFGLELPLAENEHIRLKGPSPLLLEVEHTPGARQQSEDHSNG